MTVSPEHTVADLASRYPQTIRVFQQLRIEFCCEGSRRLGEICAERQLPFDDVSAALAAAVAAPAPRRADWSTRSLAELTAHIVEAFHEPLRAELPRLHRMAAKVQHHADGRHVLAVVLYELERFTTDVASRFGRAERELFPLICRSESGHPRDEDRVRFRQLRAALEAEHAEAGHALRILRHVTHHFAAPASACATQRDLYRGLRELEQLMQLHVHLENNILLPRAAALLADTRVARSS